MEKLVLKIRCDDKPGIVAAMASFILKQGGNIVNLGQFTEPRLRLFFCRAEWEQENVVDLQELETVVRQFLIDNGLCLTYQFFSRRKPLKMALFVSKYDHCLYDILFRQRAGELKCEIPLVLSNHEDLRYVADNFGVNFHYLPVSEKNRGEVEEKQIMILEEHQIDFLALARYMQILSADFIRHFENRILNIHHSFLPAFKGAKPYHQAYERGVKIIGATAHFVTETLDQGPIIAQDAIQISHNEMPEDLVKLGRDVERRVFAKAIDLYSDHRIFLVHGRTVIL